MSDTLKNEFAGKIYPVWYWNFIVRSIVGIIGGILVSIFLTFTVGAENFWWCLTYFIPGFLLFTWKDNDETVPEAHAAMITFLGRRYRRYRGEGDYPWTGKLFFLGRSTTVKDEGTDKDGYIKIEPFQIKIWNRNDDKSTRIVAQARNNANVATTLTLSIKLWDPMLWLNNEDPVLSLAERARESFRSAIRFFTDSDCAGLKNRLGRLMEGAKLLACIMPKENANNRPFSILHDDGGRMLADMVPYGTSEANLGTAIADYRTQAERRGAHEEVQQIKKDGDDLVVEEFEVEEALVELAHALGSEITDAAVGDLQLSEPVQEASNKASAEIEQREGELKNAATFAQSAAKIGDSVKQHGELAAGIAAGANGNKQVKTVVTGKGSDPFTKAAATYASLNESGD